MGASACQGGSPQFSKLFKAHGVYFPENFTAQIRAEGSHHIAGQPGTQQHGPQSSSGNQQHEQAAMNNIGVIFPIHTVIQNVAHDCREQQAAYRGGCHRQPADQQLSTVGQQIFYDFFHLFTLSSL